MKRIIVASLFIVSSSLVLADGYSGPVNQVNGGYTGPAHSTAQVSTIKNAQSMRDDAYVTVRGKIVNHIKKDKFTLQDSTGSVVVEIDDDLWYGISVAPNDMVEIVAEVDKDSPWSNVELEAKTMRKI